MRSGKVKYCALKILLDSIMSATILSGICIPKEHIKKNTTNNGYTCGGVFQTQAKATVSFQLPELYHTKNITYAIHVYNKNNSR